MTTVLVYLAVWLAVAIPSAILFGHFVRVGAGEKATGGRSRAAPAIQSKPTRPVMGHSHHD